MATGVQTILANQNGQLGVTTDWYKTEQRGAWSLDVIILNNCGKDFEITMEVSNDQSTPFCYKVIKENVSRLNGASFIGKSLPYDYCRWVISSSVSGRYKVLFNERD